MKRSRHYYNTFIFAIFSSIVAFAQNQDFTEAALGFDPGEIKVIEAPDPDAIRPLVIATFRGIPRLGVQNDYKNPYDQSPGAQKTNMKRKQLADRMRESQDMFRQLTTINLYQGTIDFEAWKKQFDPTAHVINQNTTVNYKSPGPYWLAVFRQLALKTAKPGMYKKYFCKSEEDCKHLDRTSVIGPQIYKPSSERWGGIGSSEFEKKRKVIDFTDNLAPTYLQWAQDFTLTEAYVVGRVNLGEYNFKVGGFPLARMRPITQAFVMPMSYDSASNALFKNDYPVDRPSAILLKMPPEKAEAFSEDLKKKSPSGRGKELFYVYKITIKLKEKKDTKTAYGFTRPEFSYEQIPADQKIAFFSDIYLRDKVHEIER